MFLLIFENTMGMLHLKTVSTDQGHIHNKVVLDYKFIYRSAPTSTGSTFQDLQFA
jgi:hypothetical protein